MRTFLAHDPLPDRDARAIDEAVQHTKRTLRRGDRSLGARLIGNVGTHEARRRTQLRRERVALRVIDVREHDLGTFVDEHARGGRTEARGASGDDENAVRDLHAVIFPVP